MAIRALRRRLFVDNHGLGVNHARLLMAFVASHAFMAALQGEMRPGVMVESGGRPALRVMAVRTRCLPGLGELSVMGIFVTILADLRGVLELYFLFADRRLVTITALDGAMRSEQRELGFRMVEAIHVRPGPHVMAGFASLRRAVGTPPRHAFFEFAMMDILMAGGAGPIFEMERQDFILPSGGTDFVTVGTRHSRVGSGQGETCFAMFGDRKCGTVKIQNRMTILAFVSIRRGFKLSVMGILVTVGTGREFHLIDGVFARG